MMYIEHTNLEDNLHHILTNREPTSGSPIASEATAAFAASALLAHVREAHNSASSSLQQHSVQRTTTSGNAQYQNHNSSSTPNYKTNSKEWIRRPEPNLLPLEQISSIDFRKELTKVLSSVENSITVSRKQVQEERQSEKKEEEQFELLEVLDTDQSIQAENCQSYKVVENGYKEEKPNCSSTNHFVIDIDRQKISSVNASALAPKVQVEEDEEFEYIVTRVPKRKLQDEPSGSQKFENYSTLNRKLRRPVPQAIPIDPDHSGRLHNDHQPPPLIIQPRRPIPNLKKFTFDSEEYYNTHRALNGCSTTTEIYAEDDNSCDSFSDTETVVALSTGRPAYAYNKVFHSEQEAQMGLDILSKLKQLFNWSSSTKHYNTDYKEGKRKRRSEDWSTSESTGPQQIKYRKVENRFPKYIAVRPEEDDINEFFPHLSHHNQQQKSQKYDKQYLLNNSAQSSRTLMEMSNRRSTTDKPPLRKSMFSAPHITQQLIKNSTYADVEFSDDDEPILLKGFDTQAPTLASAKRVPQVFNIPIIQTDERLKPKLQKPPPPPLIEPRTGNILKSSLIPEFKTNRKPTYAETLRQSGGTNYWSTTQTRSSILNQEKESEERERYQQLLEQVVPRLYGTIGVGSSASNSTVQRRRSGLLLGTALASSARSSPAANRRPMGATPSFLKRAPLSSTINLDDDDEDDEVVVTGVSHLKTSRSSKAKQSLPTTVIVDDDEISDIIDLGNEERHVLSACAKIQKENNSINLCEEKVEKPQKDELPFVEPVNSLRDLFNASPHIKENWLENWESKWLQRKKHRHNEVKETVKVSEKLTAERRAAEAEIQERLRKFQIVDPELLVVDDFEDAIEEPEFVELTQEHRARINAAICGPLDQVLISKFNLNITRRDIHTLCGHNWLNDEVINFYMNLLTERGEKKSESHGLPTVYAMNTFFVPRLMQAGHGGVKRWTRRVDIFSKDIVPVPVHVGGVHWCMAIIHLKNRSIKYYDSMGTPNPTVLKALVQYLKDESMDKRKQPFDATNFVIESVQGVPRQMNGSDCGVFSCMFAEYITRNREITFSQQNMEYFRQKMILEIVMGDLLQ